VSLENHTKYTSSPTGQHKNVLGGGGIFTESGSPVGLEKVRIINKNESDSDNLIINRTSSDINFDSRTTTNQIVNFCKTYNSGFNGEIFGDAIIYYPGYSYDSSYCYNLFAVTGNFSGQNGTTSKLRFYFSPEDPESFLVGSGISAGDNEVFFPEMQKSILRKHFYYIEKEQEVFSDRYDSWVSGSGNYLDVKFGTNNQETGTITGISGNHFLLENPITKDVLHGDRIVSTNTLHTPPSGETGYAQNFQVRIDNNSDGNSRFYIAGSGVTGGCHLGGTFTGDGYTFFETPVIDVYRGFTYFFNQHHSTNHHEYMMFSYTSGGHHEGGSVITGKYKVDQGGSNYCFNNYCSYHCPDEQTFMIPIDESSPDKIYYYASGTNHVGGTGYLNVITSGDGAN
tara:strand:+ start:6157 stop:7347 length:1191 start_codon:yes stop_codon:yes gene_type:complete